MNTVQDETPGDPGRADQQAANASNWGQVIAAFSLASAPLSVLAIFEVFGPVRDMNLWFEHIVLVYRSATGWLTSILQGVGISFGQTIVDVLILCLFLSGASLRTFQALNPRYPLEIFGWMRDVILRRSVRDIVLGFVVGQITLLLSQGRPLLDATMVVLRTLAGGAIVGIVVGFTSGCVAISVIIIRGSVSRSGEYVMDDGSAIDPRAFRRALVIQSAIVMVTALVLFAFGTKFFFDFG